MLLSGLILGLLVTYGGAEGLLYMLLVVLTELQGTEQAARYTIYGTSRLIYGALISGVVLAIVCDRLWMRIRGLGPELRLKR